MTMQDVISALALPLDARVDQRVPKKLFLEQGAPTAADKRGIQDGIDEVQWVAALKPANIGVPTFKDDSREYLEISVLTAVLRQGAKAARLIELIHRAIPYPVFLITEHSGVIGISLAEKRASQAETAAVVIDGSIAVIALETSSTEHVRAFLESLRLSSQPIQNLRTLYQGWIERVQAYAAARLTGSYRLTQNASEAAIRQIALDDHARIQREIAGLRAKAAKEKQIHRRVDINLAIQRLEAELNVAMSGL